MKFSGVSIFDKCRNDKEIKESLSPALLRDRDAEKTVSFGVPVSSCLEKELEHFCLVGASNLNQFMS